VYSIQLAQSILHWQILENTIINSGEFLDQMSDCQLAKKDFVDGVTF